MNVELKIFGLVANSTELQTSGQGQPAVHPALHRQHQWVVQQIVVFMRTYNVRQVSLTLVQGVGPVAVGNAAMELMTDDKLVPPVLAGVRTKIVRDVLRPLMEVYGINTITLTLTEQELAELQKYWEFLASGEQRLLDEIRYKDIPLRYETDPTAEKVKALPPAVITGKLNDITFEPVSVEAIDDKGKNENKQ